MWTDTIEKLQAHPPVQIGDTMVGEPVDLAAREDGPLVVIDRETESDVASRFLVFSRNEHLVYSRELTSRRGHCLVSETGSLVVVATGKPENRIHLIDADAGEKRWTRDHYDGWTGADRRPPVSDIRFDDGDIQVFASGVEVYRLTPNGNLTAESRQNRNRFVGLEEGDKDALAYLGSLLSSGEPKKIIQALHELDVRDVTEVLDKSLLESVVSYVQEKDLHRIDLTDPDVPVEHQKIVSETKKLMLEQGRSGGTFPDPWYTVLETHFEHQPSEAIQHEILMIQQFDPDWARELAETFLDPETCDLSILNDKAPGTDNEDRNLHNIPEHGDRSEEAGARGCGCGGGVATVVLFLTATILHYVIL